MMSWADFIATEEAANYGKCLETATRNGHTIETAEMCSDGAVGCPDCPFKYDEQTESKKTGR